MNELLVMRHAKSDWSVGLPDFERPLNDRGVRAATTMAMWLSDQGLAPDVVVSSPAARTRATAMEVARVCDLDADALLFEDHLYHADVFTCMQTIAAHQADRLLICGHNPGLDDLVEHLATTPPPYAASGKLMTTAAIAHFRFEVDWAEIATGTAELVQLVRPRELLDPHGAQS